jgi:putative membrane protein
MESYVDVLLFKNSKGKCLITIPQVHYGPFGNLGGSDYPYQLSQIFEKYVDCSIVFHGACTHDQNPTSSNRIDEITHPVISFISDNYENFNKSKVGFVSYEYHKTTNSHLFFDDAVLSSFSRFPHTTEDMDFGLGLLLREKGKKYKEKSFILDAHNSDTGKITQFLLGSKEASEYLNSMDFLNEKISELKMEKCKFNYIKFHKPYFSKAGISNNGIGMFCFVSKKKSMVYLILDSNSINNEVKTAIESKLKQLFDIVLINTTDSHSLNKISGVINPAKFEEMDVLLDDLYSTLKELKENVSDFEMVSETIPIKVKVFGPYQSLKLIGVINALLSVLKFTVPLIFIFGILLALYILSLL